VNDPADAAGAPGSDPGTASADSRRRTVRAGLAEQVAGRLLHDITEGVYPAGTRLPPEPVLAEETGVSRLTLREAVKSLGQRGVVRVEHGRGTFVNPTAEWLPLDPELLATLVRRDRGLASQLTEVRSLVEVGAAALAAGRRTSDDLRRMRAALESAEAAFAAGDVEAFSSADIDFHQAVLTSVENHFVPALLVPVDGALREIRLQTSRDAAASRRALVMHGRIFDAIRRRSSRAAADAMSLHLRETRKHIDGMARQPSP
jgi:GntR family transcriptional regulator, transcriptional repressor for pyruvate dehydrogenase complex